jgi:hypothetical protein
MRLFKIVSFSVVILLMTVTQSQTTAPQGYRELVYELRPAAAPQGYRELVYELRPAAAPQGYRELVYELRPAPP